MSDGLEQSAFSDLASVVLSSLELHTRQRSSRPAGLPTGSGVLVVASGNAVPTGRIIFGQSARVCNEGEYVAALEETEFDSAVVISASGTKHAPIIIERLMASDLKPYLMTCKADSPAAELLRGSGCGDRVFVTPSEPEPITYNTSTYLGMILASTEENPEEIRRHIVDEVEPRLAGIGDHEAYYLIVRPEFNIQREMFVTKFDELFGGRVAGRCYTTEQTLHAKTVVPWDRELFISFGCDNQRFGSQSQRLEVPLRKGAGFAEMLAIGYFVIGYIQRHKPQWFKQHATEYEAVQKRWFEELNT